MVLRPSKYGLFYGCSTFPKCRSAHGAHPWGAPLGTPASKEVKDARIRAHDVFDKLWLEGGMKRKEAYRWLAKQLGISHKHVHMGSFDAAQCAKVVEVVTAHLKDKK